MARVVVLDAGPLAMVTHPRPNREIVGWLQELLRAGVRVVVPEIADYEVRRELVRAQKTKGVNRLDKLKQLIDYAPITTDAMLKAAEFWAQARNDGYPTAPDHSLDADVILAAQTVSLALNDDEPVIATTNVAHLARFTKADKWENIGKST